MRPDRPMSADPQAQTTASGRAPDRSSIHEHDTKPSKRDWREAIEMRERVTRAIELKQKRDDDPAARQLGRCCRATVSPSTGAGVSIQQCGDKTGAVDADPRSPAVGVQREERAAGSDGVLRRRERRRSIAPLIAVADDPQGASLRNNRDRTHRIC